MPILEGLRTFSRPPVRRKKTRISRAKVAEASSGSNNGRDTAQRSGSDHGLLLNVNVFRCADVAVPPP